MKNEVKPARQIIDNALSDEDFVKIRSIIFGDSRFPWYYASSVSVPGEKQDGPHWYKFHHQFYETNVPVCPMIAMIDPILSVLEPIALVRCRAFLTTYTGKKYQQGLHNDRFFGEENNPVSDHMKAAIYYVNTNNGGTRFADGQFVESVQNRLLIFNITEMHEAVTADDVPARVVINFNYF